METAILMVGKGILANTISEFYEEIKKGNNNVELLSILSDLDIIRDIEIIEALLMDISEKKLEHKCINICIHQIQKLVIDIKSEIETINIKLIEFQYNKKNYYLYWNWNTNYDENINKLKMHKHSLNTRVKTLINLLSINL